MPTKMFLNLPVNDLNKSVDFFTKLGYTFNAQFTNENATCMIISDTINVMLLVKPFFKQFTKNEIADATKVTEALICLSTNSRAEVDEIIGKAVAAGATTPNPKQEHDFMYGHGFQDLDGHLWEFICMNTNAVPPQP